MYSLALVQLLDEILIMASHATLYSYCVIIIQFYMHNCCKYIVTIYIICKAAQKTDGWHNMDGCVCTHRYIPVAIQTLHSFATWKYNWLKANDIFTQPLYSLVYKKYCAHHPEIYVKVIYKQTALATSQS